MKIDISARVTMTLDVPTSYADTLSLDELRDIAAVTTAVQQAMRQRQQERRDETPAVQWDRELQREPETAS